MAENIVRDKPDTNEALPVPASALLRTLDRMGISYRLHEHEPVFTVAESAHLKAHIPGMHCRNLFVRDKKENMFLVVAENGTVVDLKKLAEILGCGRLSFGSAERLWRYLGVRPGSVCPFAVINDRNADVRLILDKTLLDADIVNCHPMENHLTIGLKPNDLVAFLKDCDHDPLVLDLISGEPDVD